MSITFNRLKWRSSCSYGAGRRSISVTRIRLPNRANSLSKDNQTSTLEDAPWRFGFQVNERQLSWDDAAARRLVKLVLVEKLSWSPEAVEDGLMELACLVPDFVGKLELMRVDILMPLMQDLPGLTHKLLALRELLPGVNVSLLVSRWPALLLDFDIPILTAKLQLMRSQLPGVRVELLVNEEPMLIKADIPTVLENIRRIMPQADPVHVLVTQPTIVLDMQATGMGSALDVEGFAPREKKAQP